MVVEVDCAFKGDDGKGNGDTTKSGLRRRVTGSKTQQKQRKLQGEGGDEIVKINGIIDKNRLSNGVTENEYARVLGEDGGERQTRKKKKKSKNLCKEEEDISELRMLLFVLGYIVPRSTNIRIFGILSILFSAASRGCNIAVPLALRKAVDALSIVSREGSGNMPWTAVLMYAGAKYGSSTFLHLQAMCWERVSQDITREFAVSTFSHLHQLSMKYHNKRMTGEVLRVIDRGVSSISTLTKTFVLTIAPSFFEAFLTVAVFLKFDVPGVALVMFVSIVLYTLYSIFVTQFRKKLRGVMIDADNAVSQRATDSLVNVEIVKYFATEREEADHYERLLRKYQQTVQRATLSVAALNNGQAFIRNMALFLSLLMTAHATSRGLISAGSFVAVNAYVMQIYAPLTYLGTAYRTISKTLVDIEKVIVLHDQVPDVVDHPDAPAICLGPKAAPMVIFDDVNFTYGDEEDSDNLGLSHVSFKVPRGSSLGIVGPSGAGKSTIVRLLLRLHDVKSGRVLVNGQDVRTVTQESLRRGVGIVSQDTALFNETLRFNIAYGRPDATEKEIWAAVKAAALEELVTKLPKGLDTRCGERGVRLSGGERQRVGIARCILKDPAMILLDESTSSLDTVTERQIQMNLQDVCKGRTTVTVAHRLSTTMSCDSILVLDGGRVVESGHHDSLLALQGVYNKMWNAQLKDEHPKVGKQHNT